MKSRKANESDRGFYVYEFGGGTSVTLKPGENEVTEWDIHELHRLRDREVDNYYRNIRPKRTDEEKTEIKEWGKHYISAFKAEHGYEPHPDDVKYVVKEAFPMNMLYPLMSMKSKIRTLYYRQRN